MERAKQGVQKVCSVEGCDRPFSAKKMCSMHYQRLYKYGTVDGPMKPYMRPCAVQGCLKPYYAKTWCRTHYERMRLTGTTDLIPVGRPKKNGGPCAFDECDRKAKVNGFCSAHNLQNHFGKDLTPLRTYIQVPKDAEGRHCTKCLVWKPWDEFYARSDKPGKQANCKDCWKARCSAYLAKRRQMQNA